MRPTLFVSLTLGLAACGETPPPKPLPAPVAFTPVPGLERILGKPTTTATALLGVPGLDRHDGPGRSLQFVGAGCILDVYFYPDPAAGLPTARYAEARKADGKSDETARCFAAQLAAKGHG
jgi:hypothetical protein